ncbi:MAG: hypothetical protein EOO78_05215 [Oxalobacteraceae bacterium]|nr:MAG: hypothetical protein EOO78_05215 [Oxalobacteraceae bacterium]
MPMFGSSEAIHQLGRSTRPNTATIDIRPSARATASSEATSRRARVDTLRVRRSSQSDCQAWRKVGVCMSASVPAAAALIRRDVAGSIATNRVSDASCKAIGVGAGLARDAPDIGLTVRIPFAF